MQTTADRSDTEAVQVWLRQAFHAERAAAPPCVLLLERAPSPRTAMRPVVRGSFVLMLVVSAAGLLLLT